MIFLHNVQHKKNKNTKKKLYFKWNESYQIFKIVDNKDIYLLIKLNDTKIRNTFAKNQFKKFHVQFFNASEQIKNNAESRVMIDRFSFFEIFSKSEFFDDFFDVTFDHEIFKTNENSVLFDWFLIVVIFFCDKTVINCCFFCKKLIVSNCRCFFFVRNKKIWMLFVFNQNCARCVKQKKTKKHLRIQIFKKTVNMIKFNWQKWNSILHSKNQIFFVFFY